MRKTKWRGRDKVKDASRRLQAILRNSRKLRVAPEDLSVLTAVSRLRTSCERGQEPVTWLILGVLVAGILLVLLLLLTAGEGLIEGLACTNSSTKEIQVQTVQIDRHPLEDYAEESTLFNDSEDTDSWQPGRLRLRKE